MEEDREFIFSPEKVSKPTRKLLIPIDGSPASDYCVKWALDNIVRKDTDHISLLHVRKSKDQDKAASHQLLIGKCKDIQDLGIVVRGVALVGDAKKMILEEIENNNPDMIIIGSRGLGAVSRTLLGSLTEHVIHNCSVPVVVTRPPK